MWRFEELEKMEARDRAKLWRAAAIVLAVLCVLMALGGCQYAAPAVGSGVDTYCTATDPEDQAALRQRFDQETEPHEIRIRCNQKPEKTEGNTDGESG